VHPFGKPNDVVRSLVAVMERLTLAGPDPTHERDQDRIGVGAIGGRPALGLAGVRRRPRTADYALTKGSTPVVTQNRFGSAAVNRQLTRLRRRRVPRRTGAGAHHPSLVLQRQRQSADETY
jgi:hypothetical protein